jgi:catechol 2,3-dioxygenase-like lactoylglutathione lyase family enzyme
MADPAVVEITVADEPGAWTAAGFSVSDGVARCGGIAIRLAGRADGGRIQGWRWSDLAGTGAIDGLPTERGSPTTSVPDAHPNGTTLVDHIVVVTPDLDRTVTAFEARGLEVRRVRHTDQYGPPFRQVFFRGGETIIEVIGPEEADPADDRPAHFYGLAFTVGDIDATARLLGDHLGRIKDAVQPGRRIATLRHKDLDVSVPVAFMSA